MLILPSIKVPVTTVPNPFTENTLSILSLAGEYSFLSSMSLLILSIFFILKLVLYTFTVILKFFLFILPVSTRF